MGGGGKLLLADSSDFLPQDGEGIKNFLRLSTMEIDD